MKQFLALQSALGFGKLSLSVEDTNIHGIRYAVFKWIPSRGINITEYRLPLEDYEHKDMKLVAKDMRSCYRKWQAGT